MKNILSIAAMGEIMTGLALLIVPSVVGELLLGETLTGIAIPVARTLGISLIALGVACWSNGASLLGMMTYSTLVAIYLGVVAVEGNFTGQLLWPVVVLHAILTVFLVRVWFQNKKVSP